MTTKLTDEKMFNYLSNVNRVSREYNLSKYYVFETVKYVDHKRINRGGDGDLEKSLKVVERWLRLNRE